MMDNDFKDLRRFFKEEKTRDESLNIPVFGEMYPKRKLIRKYWIPSGIAASILFLVIANSIFKESDSSVINHYEVEVNLTIEETNTYSLISNQSNVYSWEAPSTTLISDFHEW
jgi:hypothetical protein